VASGPTFAALWRGEQWFATANPSFGGSVVRSPVYSSIADLSAVAAAKADHHSRPAPRRARLLSDLPIPPANFPFCGNFGS